MKNYKFLVSDGNGAASRGWDVDYYGTYEIQAENDKDAYDQLFLAIRGYETVEDYLLEYCYGVDSFEELNEEEKLEFKEDLKNFDGKDILDNMDISGGDPWVEGVMIDGVVTVEPDYDNMMEYGCQFEDDSPEIWNLPVEDDYDEED